MLDTDELVSECRDALRESQPQLAVKEVLARALADPSAASYGSCSVVRGRIDTLHRSAELTVLHIVWPPNVRLYPHDHRMWAANAICAGREDNTYYRRAGGRLERTGGSVLEGGDVLLLGAEAIHAVLNPVGSYTSAIHVYGGDYFATPRSEWNPDTLEEQPFDFEHLKRVLADADAAARTSPGGLG